jgi:hypothetical protein
LFLGENRTFEDMIKGTIAHLRVRFWLVILKEHVPARI